MKSTIRLFKALPIEEKRTKTNKDLFKKTIKYGFVFSPEVIANYTDYDGLIEMVRESIGLTSEEMNSAFHKSWVKIREADLEDLVIEQIAHYMTTYGRKNPEIYLTEKETQFGVEDLSDIERDKVGDIDYIYIPKEKLNIPKIDIDGIRLVVIKGYTKEELKDKLLRLLNSGVALADKTIKDVLDVATFVEIKEREINSVRNKEAKSALCDYLNIFPKNPVEFLRFVVYKTTNKTLLIKNNDLISEIKEKDNLGALKLFQDYEKKYGLDQLAEIFYRFKPILLAFRTNKGLKRIINKIRKLAVRYHKPLPEDYLNTITAKLKNNKAISQIKLKGELEKVNVFRKIRLAYALHFRTEDIDAILYRVRNGKGYATDFDFKNKEKAKKVLEVVMTSIIGDVKKNVGGKKVYIPDWINYTLPATEKQFTGYFPSGTYISIPKDMVFGIHWENVKRNMIDLDLSLISPETGKVGWDSSYRTDNKKILFSGDITDAPEPRGASELFYIGKQPKNALILFVNYFNFNEKISVPFKIIVAKEQVKDFRKNYVINPNNVLAVAKSEIDKKQKMLGLIITSPEENRFYFVETNIGKSIASSDSYFTENSRKYLFGFYENAIGLKYVLEKAGAKLVKEKNKADIDLSPESLEKDTILRMLSKK